MDAFKLDIDLEEMVVKLIASPPLPDTFRDPDMVRDALKENNIFQGIKPKQIELAFEGMEDLEEGDEFIIAEGKLPIHGQNGSVDFLVNISGKAIYDGSVAENEDDKIDFKNAVKIESVKPGQILAKIIPPTKGESGYSLAGKELPARNGKPAVIGFGEGVEVDPDGATIRAIQEGRPVYAHKRISVNPAYEIHGDVCYETGNIKFDGYVHINGNVQDDFIIEAKNIEINGAVGAATIRCKNNLIVHGGINGHSKAEVICHGSADVKYINAANVEVKGDLNVGREIVNARVWCAGKVNAGKIIGGEVIALQGIYAKTFGSELGIPTLIEPGTNYEIRRIDNAIEVLTEQIHKITRPISAFLGNHKKFLSLPQDKQEEIIKNYTFFKKIKDAFIKLHTARHKIISKDNSPPVKQAIVLKHMYTDVTIKTSSCVKHFRTEVNGPAALVEDISHGTITVAGYNPSKDEVIVKEKEEQE